MGWRFLVDVNAFGRYCYRFCDNVLTRWYGLEGINLRVVDVGTNLGGERPVWESQCRTVVRDSTM